MFLFFVSHAIFFNRHLVSVTRKSDFYDLNFVETVTRDVIVSCDIMMTLIELLSGNVFRMSLIFVICDF